MKNTTTKIISIICILTMLAAACACGGKDETTAPETTEETTAQETAAPITVAAGTNPLTGETGYADKNVNIRPVAIVVENTPQARPQWGTGSADICIEYEVEGGISRMLWLYANAEEIPAKVGPVRSARHDAQELALGFDAIFVCWGKSSLATNAATNDYKIDEINGMSSSSYFAKDTERNADSEHLGFTTGENMNNAIAALGLRTSITEGYYGAFKFASKDAPVALTGGEGNSARVYFSGNYIHDFTYSAETGLYTNSMGGKTMTDENGNADEYKNVITLFVDSETLPTTHVDLKLENGGSGYVVSNGTRADIKWSKGIYSDKLNISYADGTSVTLNAGRTYIGFVRSTISDNSTAK